MLMLKVSARDFFLDNINMCYHHDMLPQGTVYHPPCPPCMALCLSVICGDL